VLGSESLRGCRCTFELDGSSRFIEVKTTKGSANTDFFISANEVEFASRHGGAYYLYRLYDFDPAAGRGCFYVRRGAVSTDASLELQPVQFRVRIAAAVTTL